MNTIQLVGKLGKDPDVRVTQDQRAISKFSLATRGYKGDAVWHSVEAWGKTAEFIGNYFKKGTSVWVTGELCYSKYTSKDGIEKTIAFIRADKVGFAGSKSDAENRPQVKSSEPSGFEGYPDHGLSAQDSDIPF